MDDFRPYDPLMNPVALLDQNFRKPLPFGQLGGGRIANDLGAFPAAFLYIPFLHQFNDGVANRYFADLEFFFQLRLRRNIRAERIDAVQNALAQNISYLYIQRTFVP